VTPLTTPRPTTLVSRDLLRWVYIGRLAIALAIFLAAVFGWQEAPRNETLIATFIILAALVFTTLSAGWSEIYRRGLTDGFLGAQVLFDLALVTGIVHITGGPESQFTALYILVIAVSALILSNTAGLLVAALACVMYFTDVILAHQFALDVGIWLQLGVFAGVALSSGYIAARLREARAGRAELEAELLTVRLQAEEILRNIRSGIVTVDAEGRLVYANPAAGSLLGVDLGPRVGEPVLTVIERSSPALALALERAIRRGIRTSRAEGRVTSHARHFPIGLNTTVTASEAAAHDGNGHRAAEAPVARTATAIFQDISDQKRLDTLHLRTQRLEAVAELSASLAHEIKNPLASIRSAVEQIGHSPRATPDERTLTELIVRESDRLARLLSEFLDFARVRVSHVERLDVATVARGAANLAAAHPGRPDGVSVAVEVPGEPLHIEGDEDLLHRALFNLILNGVQASPAGGVVRVQVAPLSPDDAPAGVSLEQGGAAIRVSDSGPGIPAEIRDRLFDPFFTTKPGGSGLGLAIVHRAIESHRGYVFVDSDESGGEKGGTRITVLLPRDHAQPGESR
jgi:two-component system sensor histidine kinase PilS (NtrC family)